MSQTETLITATGKQPRPYADLAAYRWLLQRLFGSMGAPSPREETPSPYAWQRSEGIKDSGQRLSSPTRLYGQAGLDVTRAPRLAVHRGD